ncbi:MAG: hypothetical protein KIS77_18085 [Saprospiraceae bacterium]|nr:hypothetical protein [Saprospiraceae bacterium]
MGSNSRRRAASGFVGLGDAIRLLRVVACSGKRLGKEKKEAGLQGYRQPGKIGDKN